MFLHRQNLLMNLFCLGQSTIFNTVSGFLNFFNSFFFIRTIFQGVVHCEVGILWYEYPHILNCCGMDLLHIQKVVNVFIIFESCSTICHSGIFFSFVKQAALRNVLEWRIYLWIIAEKLHS